MREKCEKLVWTLRPMKKEVGTPDAETEITLHPIGRSHVGVVEYFLQGAPYRELMLEQIFSWKTAAQGGDQHWIRGKMWRQSSVREELLWLQNTVLLRVGGQRNLEWRSEVDPGEKVGGKVLFYFILFFSLSKYILIGNQIFFSTSSLFACDGNWQVISLSLSHH